MDRMSDESPSIQPTANADGRPSASVRHIIGLVPAFGAFASTLVVVFALNAFVASQRSEHLRMVHLVPAEDAAVRLSLALADQEVGVREYAITGDEQFLGPYERGIVDEGRQFERLDDVLLIEYPEIHALLEPLRRSVTQWRVAVAVPLIELVRVSRADEAAQILTASRDGKIFDEMRVQLDDLRGAIAHAREASQGDRDLRFGWLFIATLLGAAVAIAAAALTWLLTRRRVAEPLERLAQEASSVAAGRLDTNITPGGPAEIDTVARSVEQMRVQLLGEMATAFASGMVEAEEAERTRLAGELHDDPIQVLTSAQWQLEALAARLPDQDRPAATAIAVALADVQARLRTLMFRLHPPGLDDEGLATALDDLLLDTFDHTDVEIRLAVDLPSPLAPAGSTLVFRIASEAIRNVRKHARSSSIDVMVRTTGDGVQLSIVDDGHGTGTSVLADTGVRRDDRDQHHHGIAISRSLAAAAGGWWRLSSQPGVGTTVTCWLPAAFVDASAAGPSAMAVERP